MDLDLSYYYKQAMASYKSPSQLARKVTEKWASDNLYCPKCGRSLNQWPTNTPVYDFYCGHSDERIIIVPEHLPSSIENFQLKSQKHQFYNYVLGGAYGPMVASLKAGRHPSLMLLHYHQQKFEVEDVTLIHRLSITLSCIKARKPLSSQAKRRGWQGCVILLDQIPAAGRIGVIENGNILEKAAVIKSWNGITQILQGDLTQRGWIADIMRCIDRLPTNFTLSDAYEFETELAKLHPENMHIRPKIRQQLQVLRDRGYIRFIELGRYQKII